QIVGGDGQDGLGHGERAVGGGDGVIGQLVVRVVERGHDRVSAHRAVGVGRARVSGGDVVPGLNADQRAGERRVGGAIGAAGVGGGHAQSVRSDRQYPVGEGDGIIGGREAGGNDVISAR